MTRKAADEKAVASARKKTTGRKVRAVQPKARAIKAASSKAVRPGAKAAGPRVSRTRKESRTDGGAVVTRNIKRAVGSSRTKPAQGTVGTVTLYGKNRPVIDYKQRAEISTIVLFVGLVAGFALGVVVGSR